MKAELEVAPWTDAPQPPTKRQAGVPEFWRKFHVASNRRPPGQQNGSQRAAAAANHSINAGPDDALLPNAEI